MSLTDPLMSSVFSMHGYGCHKKYLIWLYWWTTHTHTRASCVSLRGLVCVVSHTCTQTFLWTTNHRNISTHISDRTSLEERGFHADPASVLFKRLRAQITYKTIPWLRNAHPRTCFKLLMLFRWVRKLVWMSQSSWGQKRITSCLAAAPPGGSEDL